MALDTPRNRYIGVLALIAAFILVVGWQWRPDRPSEAPASQADLTRLARLSQRSTLEGMAGFFADVARQASAGLLWIDGVESQGIVWDQAGSILSASLQPHPHLQTSVRGMDDGDIPLQTELYSDPLSFRLLKAPPELALTPQRMVEPRNIRQGNWLVAVWRTSTDLYEFAPGIYSGFRPVTCGGVEVVELLTSFGDAPRSVGSAIFTLDGDLAGIAFQCEHKVRLIAVSSLGKAVERARAVDSQLQFRYGFRPVELDDRSKSYFNVDRGLLVMEVWFDTLAWELGLRPGDVITMLDSEPVSRLDDLAMMTVPMYRPEYTLSIRRGRTTRTTVFPPGEGLGPEPNIPKSRSVVLGGETLGIAIRSVEPGTPESRAGLRPGDRLVSLGPQYNPSRPDVTALDSQRQAPLFAVIARQDELLGLFLH